MPVTVATPANEKSTLVITASFTDEAGSAVTPDSIAWTLTNDGGRNIINRREDVSATPASSVNIVLSGDDLALSNDADATRRLTIEATYTSTYGSGLPLKESVSFTVSNINAVT